MSQHEIRALARALRQGCRISTAEIVGGDSSPLVRDGLLVRDGTMSEWPVDDDYAPIFGSPAEGYHYCDASGKHELLASTIQLWRADPSAVAHHIARSMDCRDRVEEIVPGLLYGCGATTYSIGRHPLRSTYFAPSMFSGDEPYLSRIEENENFILITGFSDGVQFSGRFRDRAFRMEQIFETNVDGLWTLHKDRLDSSFKRPEQPQERRSSKAKQKKIFEIAELLMRKCFELRHDWNALCALRKKIATQQGLADEVGLKRSTANDYFSKEARSKNENPLAFFWWDTLLDRDCKYACFEAFLDQEHVRASIPKYQSMKPDTLKELIEKHNTATAIKLAGRKTKFS